ncbi:hypothetical protein IEQ34_007052 [Dendrobium chrysotoxum]|uniref:NB-ARC domain-containing protein n=1 Tax=Dendrobium chrysotoxum TaxID=161865 RepID=A0AAV7H5A5_DENCH|nr:hypothetical protein IEQ34_007052 [Dendrobium chrysotoxum]
MSKSNCDNYWLREQSNEEHQIIANVMDLYRNISLLSIVGHGGIRKTTLLQRVYEDETTEEFDLNTWRDSKKKGGALGSPLAAKVIGGVLKDNLDERHWREVLENNLLGQNPINSILKLSFILPPCIRGEALKDIGGRYFDVLVRKSLFDKTRHQHITYYIMHDLLHELAQFVSAQESFRAACDEEFLSF